MKLAYIQRKSAVSSILWILGCGLGMTHYPIRKVYAGRDLGDTIWICRKGEGILCGDRNTKLEKLNADFQKYIIHNPGHVAKIKDTYLQRSKGFRKFISRLAVYDYQRASNERLWVDYQSIVRGYAEVYPYSEPLIIALGDLATRIKARFRGKGLSDEQFKKILLPDGLSFVQREYKELLKIALGNKGKKLSLSTNQKLIKHTKEYTWLPYDYGVTNYSLVHFRHQVESILKKRRGVIKEKLQRLEEYSRRLKLEQRKIISEFKISQKDLALVEVIRTAFLLVDSKKELFSRCHWYAGRLFSEIAVRSRLPFNLAAYMLPDEVKDFLLKGKGPDKDKIKSRYNHSVLRICPDGTIRFYPEAQAKKIINGFFKAKDYIVDGKTIKGVAASKGRVRGRVRILTDARQGEFFRHGEILATAMTSPDYMLAVRRAAAIITDEGGITCHAAIISRELGIPCVIATKVATQVLRDGDLVEVNADKGIVKILEKAK